HLRPRTLSCDHIHPGIALQPKLQRLSCPPSIAGGIKWVEFFAAGVFFPCSSLLLPRRVLLESNPSRPSGERRLPACGIDISHCKSIARRSNAAGLTASPDDVAQYMADKKRQRRSELDNLREELGPYFQQTSPRRGGPETPQPGSGSGSGSFNNTINNSNNTSTGGSMSQRNRSGRGSNRNNGNSSHGEEAQIWESCKSQMADIVAGVNAENDSLGELVELDKRVGAMDPDKVPNDSLKQMEQLCRKGVKFSEANISSLKAVTEQLKILRAVVVAKEQAEAAAAASAAGL
ncbi:SAGA-associated factor 29, partial [Tolypocladium paradoxum]